MQRHAVQAQLFEGVPDDEADGLGAETAVTAARADQDAEAAIAVGLVPVVQDHLADEFPARPVHDAQVEPVGLGVPGRVPGAQPVRVELLDRAAGEPEHLGIVQDPGHDGDVVLGERPQYSPLAGENGFDGEVHLRIFGGPRTHRQTNKGRAPLTTGGARPGSGAAQSSLRPRLPGRDATHARTVSAYQ